jgi:phosphatidylserine/phosphatidylglycerophosphate/cardiolipin synthase-like enzyme
MNSRVIVKNVKTTPAFADNDGRTAAACSCVVFTAADDAAVVSAEIDLSPLAGPPRAPLKPRAGQRLPGTNDGAYAARFTVPQLTDPGRYELPIAARDSAGNAGAGRARFDVIYRRPDYRGGPLAPDNQRALARLAGSPIAPGNRVEVLADGAAAMDKRLAMLAAAKKQINLQTYLFDREVGGARFYDALLARFNAGVQANIILNADTQIPAALLSTLRLSFHHLLSEISEFLGTLRPTTPAEREFLSWQKRLAEWKKSVNLILFSGSRLRERGLAPLRRGEPLAVWLQKMLDDAAPIDPELPAGEERRGIERRSEEPRNEELFQGPGGLPALPLLDYATHEKILAVDGAQAIVGGRNLTDEYFSRWIDADLWLEGPIVGHVQKGFFRSFGEFADDPAKRVRPAAPARGGPAAGGSPVQFVQSRPWLGDVRTLRALVTAFQMAQHRIFAYSQYLVLPDSLLLDALLDAARRGVEVKILTNSQTTAQDVNFGTGYFVTLNHLLRLLEAGVRVYLLDGDPSSKNGQPYMHVKEFLIDGQLACFGSFNLSMRSCFIESENLVNVFDPAVAEAEESRFWNRISRRATEATTAFVRDQIRLHRGKLEIARALELLF